MTEESTAKTNNLNEQPSNNTINTNDNNTINNTTPQDQNEQNKPNLNQPINSNNNININKQETKIDFDDEVKNYIRLSLQDDNYSKLIKENPMELFDFMSEEKLDEWSKKLFQKENKNKNIDDEILSTALEIQDQKVIHNDSVRTRVRESVLYPKFQEQLKKILTYYCKTKDAHYKQGLNEIFGPLILLQYKIKNFSFTNIYNLGSIFIDKFLPNYYYEKEIYSLKSGLDLFLILLKYHEPTVYNRLNSAEVIPEVYATNWIMTLLSGKLKLNILFYFWDYIIDINDNLFIFFILVAMINHKRKIILNCDKNYIASFMTALNILSLEELKLIINKAQELRTQTPYSFRILANKIGFLIKKNPNIKNSYEYYNPHSIQAMPFFPSEIFLITSKEEEEDECIDPFCKNYLKQHKLLQNITADENNKNKSPKKDKKNKKNLDENKEINNNNEVIENYRCEKCDMKIKKNMKFFLLDIRILQYNDDEDDSDKTGYIPKMVMVPQDELKAEDFSSTIMNRYISERGNFHFIFLTSSTDNFSKFENNMYVENITDEERTQMIFGLKKQQKIDKELDFNNAKEKLSIKEIYKLKEYDNLRKTLKVMKEQNFPYVGYVYGGFMSIHEESLKYGIELLLHSEETCLLCQEHFLKNKHKNKKEEDIKKKELYDMLWEQKKKIKYNNLDQFYNNPKNKVHLCVLYEYKSKKIQTDQIQIFINISFEKYVVEIYKFDQSKDFSDSDNLNIDKDEEANNEIELTSLEELSVSDIISITVNKVAKNLVIITIKGQQEKKGIGLFKKRSSLSNPYNIILDFSSAKDSKQFISSFKAMSEEFRAMIKKNKKSK